LTPDVWDQVIICRYDSIAPGLIDKLDFNQIPYFVLEPDPVAAAHLAADGVSVVSGEIESRETWERLQLPHARMVLVNAEDRDLRANRLRLLSAIGDTLGQVADFSRIES